MSSDQGTRFPIPRFSVAGTANTNKRCCSTAGNDLEFNINGGAVKEEEGSPSGVTDADMLTIGGTVSAIEGEGGSSESEGGGSLIMRGV